MSKRIRLNGSRAGNGGSRYEPVRRTLRSRSFDDPQPDYTDNAPANGDRNGIGPSVGPRNLPEGNLQHLTNRGGRPKGVPNTFPRTVKNMVMRAMELHGSDGEGADAAQGYLNHLARDHKGLFVSLLRRTLPVQVKAEIDPNGFTSQLIERLREVQRRQQLEQTQVPTRLIDYQWPNSKS